jgi:hypothetical protein
VSIATSVCVFCFTCRCEWPIYFLVKAGWKAAFVEVWLGWACLAKTVRKPQRGGVNFDPPVVFWACSV